MKKVLIVDDDQGFILSLQDMLKEHTDKFQAITAGNGKEALAILKSQPISLVVTDLKMPEMDGFQLVSQISRLSNIVPVIAMTAFGTPEMEDRLMNMGAFQYIEKPIDFGLLLQKIQDGLKAGAKGHVSGISLPSFLQLLELDKKTCTITAKAGARTGLLFFQNGDLINAYTEPIEGLDAAFEIISWEQAEIEIYNFCQNRKRTIEVPLGFILIEGARLSDEKAERSAREGDGQAAASLADELDQLDDLDFATVPPPPPELPREFGGDPRSVLEHKLNNNAGVARMVLIAGDGSVLAQKNIDNKEFKPFVTYVSVAADKIRTILGYGNLPKHIILTQEKGEKLLILPGPKLSVGIEVHPEVSPTKIAASLAQALAEAQA
ncbi:response regulator [Thiovibrio sp. JS02]